MSSLFKPHTSATRHLHTALALQSLDRIEPDALSTTLDELPARLSTAAAAAAHADNNFDSSILDTIENIASTATFGGLALCKGLSPLVGAAALLLASPAAFGQPRNPYEYPSAGSFQATGYGDVYINTTSAMIWNTIVSPPIVIPGTIRDGAAVFCFDNVSVGPQVIVRVSGGRPMVLLSRTSISIQGDLRANGASAFDSSEMNSALTPLGYGLAGTGLGGGPGLYNGFAYIIGGSGGGPGGGFGGVWGRHPSGGSFGGAGGPGTGAVSVPAYGNLLRHLEGGSGGGGTWCPPNRGLWGGGGGGAIELGALGSIDIGGPISSNGGNGADARYQSITYSAGGGSGGGILVHAPSVQLSDDGLLMAIGGRRNGGGGRIAIQSLNQVPLSLAWVFAGGPDAQPGSSINAHPILDIATTVNFGAVPIGSTARLPIPILNAGDPDTVINGLLGEPAPNSAFGRIGSGIVSGVRPDVVGAAIYTFTPTTTQTTSTVIQVITNAGVVNVTLTGSGDDGCGDSDFNGDGDFGTDADIEAFFRVLAGGHC